jgi:hypothetical protein
MPDSPSITLLALDPSTDRTGAVILAGDLQKCRFITGNEFVGTARERVGVSTLTAQNTRIYQIARALERWVQTMTHLALTAAAYEYHTARGGAPSEAISKATGAYLALHDLCTLPCYRIQPMTAKAVWGGTRLRQGETKPAVVAWARREFGLPLLDDQDAIADALAVGLAAWGIWRKEELEKQQKPMLGRGSGKPRARKEVAGVD